MASASRVRVGTLVPLAKDNAGTANGSVSSIPIFEGFNVVGRDHLVVADKRVSRKHLSLHASADGSIEVVVEGPNPVIVRSEGQRRKVCAKEKAKVGSDDVLELIPGDYFVKYVDMGAEHNSSVPMASYDLKKGKRHMEDDTVASKRNRQIMEDEALARTLQESFVEQSTTVSDVASGAGQTSNSNDSGSSKRNNEGVHSVGPLKDVSPLSFRLMRVQGLPSWANASSVTIQDVIQGEVHFAVLSNYMVDIDWLLTDLRSRYHLEQAMLLVYPQGIRVVVHTANLIHVDWNNKTRPMDARFSMERCKGYQ